MHLVVDWPPKSVQLFISYQEKIRTKANYRLPEQIVEEQELIRIFRMFMLRKLFSRMKTVKSNLLFQEKRVIIFH